MDHEIPSMEALIAQNKKLLIDCLRRDPTVAWACRDVDVAPVAYYQYRDEDPEFARRADEARNPQSISSPTESYFFPTALSALMCPKVQPNFIGWQWWQEPLETFREKQKQAFWADKLETRPGVIAGWRWCPEAMRLIEWAKKEVVTTIEPVIIGGCFGGFNEKICAQNVQIFLYFPGHSNNTNNH